MEPLEDKVLCEQAGAHYRVLAVGPSVTKVAVGDTAVLNKDSILHTLTPKKPKVFVREADILAKIPGAAESPPAPAS